MNIYTNLVINFLDDVSKLNGAHFRNDGNVYNNKNELLWSPTMEKANFKPMMRDVSASHKMNNASIIQHDKHILNAVPNIRILPQNSAHQYYYCLAPIILSFVSRKNIPNSIHYKIYDEL